MLYVFLSIFCSVIVAVLLKLAKRYHIDVLQAITWNYSAAIFLTWIIYKPQITPQVLHMVTNYTYLSLGVLLPVMFLLIKSAIQATGIVLTEVAQRLSLFIPIIAAFLLFGEQLNNLKIIGLSLGFAAIVCSIPWRKGRGAKKSTGAWYFLLTVFLGMGVIDILFKRVAVITVVPYTTSLFIIFVLAFMVSLVFVAIQIVRKRTKFSLPHVLIGWVLGAANFCNILFYLKAHQTMSTQPS